MPAAIAIPAIATVVGGGVAAAASIYGANQASDATRRATAAQTDYNNRALVAAQEQRDYERTHQQEQRDYQRNQQNQYQARLAPYAAEMMPAFGRLNGLLDPANIGMTGYTLPPPGYVPPPQVQTYATPQPSSVKRIGGGQ